MITPLGTATRGSKWLFRPEQMRAPCHPGHRFHLHILERAQQAKLSKDDAYAAVWFAFAESSLGEKLKGQGAYEAIRNVTDIVYNPGYEPGPYSTGSKDLSDEIPSLPGGISPLAGSFECDDDEDQYCGPAPGI